MRTLANIEDEDETQHRAAFHQGLHYLLRQTRFSEEEIHFYLEIETCDHSIYAID